MTASAAPVTSTTADSAPSLHLVHQPWTVGPGQDFSVTLSVSGIRGTAGDVRVTVFSRLHTRSALAQTIAGNATGVATYQSPARPLGSFRSPAPDQFQLSLALQTPDSTGSSASASGAAGAPLGPAPLSCDSGPPGGCGGVYPVQIELTTPGGASTRLTTELVYAYPSTSALRATSPLRVALVVPLVLASTATRTAPGAVTELGRVAGALEAARTLPLTVVPEAAGLAELSAASSARDRQVAADMVGAMTDPAHQDLARSYVPVDADALVGAGLSGDLVHQVAESCAVLAPWQPTTGIWVTATGLDPAAASVLGAAACDPVRELVVPASSVSGGACTVTCTAPFSVTSAGGTTVEAAESDTQLDQELAAPTRDPSLSAHNLVADLSLTYYEAPTPRQARGVVLDVPSAAAVSPTELADVLRGMASDPVVEPVTLSQYFAQIPVGANHQPATRRLVGASSASGLPARMLREAHARLAAYAGAVDATSGGRRVVAQLGAELLRAESSVLRPVEQRQAATQMEDALNRQLVRVTIPNTLVRLTSSSVLRVPVTLSNGTGFPVSGVLTVSSDKLLFSPSGSCRGIDPVPAGFSGVSCPVNLDKTTDAVYVAMRARISGDFRMTVALEAPDGHLVLAHAQITVRSLSTSIEAVALSAAALVVLVAWWIRTHRRARRRARHARRRKPSSSIPRSEPAPDPSPASAGAPSGSEASAGAPSGSAASAGAPSGSAPGSRRADRGTPERSPASGDGVPRP